MLTQALEVFDIMISMTTERVRNEKGQLMAVVVDGRPYKTKTKSCRVDEDTNSRLEITLAATGETFREWLKRNVERDSIDLKNAGHGPRP